MLAILKDSEGRMLVKLVGADVLLAIVIYAIGHMSFGKSFFPFFGLSMQVFSMFLNLYLTGEGKPKVVWHGIFTSFIISISIMALQIIFLDRVMRDEGFVMVFMGGGLVLSFFLALMAGITYGVRN